MAPALRIPVSVSMEQFEQQMSKVGDVTRTVVRQMEKEFIKLNAQIAIEGVKALATFGAEVVKLSIKMGAAQAAMRTAFRFAVPIASFLAIKGVFEAMAAITELARQKIEEFSETAKKAGEAGVSTEFFQRWAKGGEAIKLSVDDATAALNRFNEASKDALGGSQLAQRIKQLQDAGNLQGNTGVGAFAGAIGSEDRMQALVNLIDQALDKGERLAALDLTEKGWGPKVAANLAADAGYLDKMLASARAIKETDIISEAEIGRAIELQTRLEAAQKLLADKWKPLQQSLVSLGMDYNESWINFYENLAGAVGYANQLLAALGKIPGIMQQAGSASFWKNLTDWFEKYGLNSRPADMVMPGEPGYFQGAGLSPAQQQLADRMKNPAAMQAAMRQATQIQSLIRGDTSTAPTTTTDRNDAVDRAIDSLRKHTEAIKADAAAVGLGDKALAEFRATAQETAAVQANGGKETEEQAAKFAKLREEAGKAADALARARIANDISVGRQTAFLTPEDVAIARQLAGIYGSDIPAALASSEAAQLRYNNSLQQMASLGQDVNRSLFVEFTQGLRNGKTAWQAFADAGVNALNRITDKLVQMAADQVWKSAFGGTSGGGFSLGGLFGSGSTPTMSAAGDLGAGTGGLQFPMFASGTNSAPGGLAMVGERGPELVNIPRGSQVIPNSVLRAAAGSSGAAINYSPAIDARGASVEAVARLAQILEQDRASFAARTVATIQQARRARIAGV